MKIRVSGDQVEQMVGLGFDIYVDVKPTKAQLQKLAKDDDAKAFVDAAKAGDEMALMKCALVMLARPEDFATE